MNPKSNPIEPNRPCAPAPITTHHLKVGFYPLTIDYL
jgi:hypothetical protein